MKTYVQLYLAEFLLEREIFQTKLVEQIRTHILYAMIISQKSCRLWDNVEQYGTARQVWDGNIMRRRKDAICMQDNWRKSKDTHTHNIFNLLLHNRLTLPDLVKCFIAARTKLEKPRNFVSAITICLAKLYV